MSFPKLSPSAHPAHETLRIALAMALIGGFLDAYTYLSFDGVFAFAQTGNLVLLGIHAASGEWGAALRYLLPVLVFFTGILFSEALKSRLTAKNRLHWEQLMLVLQGTLLLAIGLLGHIIPHLLSLTAINFSCSMQMHAFRRVRGVPYVSTMCTGNLRSAAELAYHAARTHNKKEKTQSLSLLLTVACFVGGVLLGSLTTQVLHTYAVLLILPLLALPFLLLGCIKMA